MSNDNYFLKESDFTSGNLFTGFLKDTPDSRDYKFSDLLKKQGKLKTVKKKVEKLVPPNRGSYRKASYGKVLKIVTISEDVPVKQLLNAPLQIDHSNNSSSVKNQGRLGSCVGFAATAMKEIQEQKEHTQEVLAGKRDYRRGKEFDYSEAWVYWNCKKIDGIPNKGGTFIRTAMKVLNKIGVPVEKAWPYVDSRTDIGKPKRWANLVARWATIGSYWRVYNSAEIKIALIDTPVIIGVPVYAEWFRPFRGIVPYPADLGRSYGGHAVCLSGDTIIPLLNGESKTIKELAKNYKNEIFEVYSCSKEGEIKIGKAHSPRKTGINKKVLKITFDNGEFLKCTEDHLIMSRDGSYIKAKDLRVNDSLMPLYKKENSYGYEMIYNNKNKKWRYTHRINSLCRRKMVVHHKDFNKKNNNSENLEIMSWDNHTTLHSKNTITLKKYSQSKIGREKSRQIMIKNWENNDFREKMLKINSENGKKNSEKLLKEGRLGFQSFSKEKMKKIGARQGKKNHRKLHTKEAIQKSVRTRKEKFITDLEFRAKKIKTAIENLVTYNDDIKKGKIEITENQKEARRKNALNMNKDKEMIRMRSLKTTYTRFYKDDYKTFEDYLKVKLHNHKIISIEEYGCEDVYDITVDKYHNFAIDSGIFVHNCVVGYDDDRHLFKFKNSWGCYDDQTEVLTKKGFKYFKNLNDRDIIATLNEKGAIEYHKYKKYIEYFYSGDMYEFKNSKIDLFVTPNHNMYIQTLRDRQKQSNNFEFIKAESIKNKQIVFKRDGVWGGKEKDFFELPEITKKINATKTIKIDKTKIPMDVWVEFLGYFLSEGSITKNKCKNGGSSYYISISQSKKENRNKIKRCLEKMNYSFYSNKKEFRFQNQQMFTYLKQFGKCNEKYISEDIKELGIRQLEILYEALMLGDGSVVVGQSGSKKKTYYTTSKQLSDDFQEICLKLGYCSTISIDDRTGQKNSKGYNYNFPVYNVNIQNTQSFNSANTILNYSKSKNKKEYDGKVYCVEVPNHTLFIRRNGKTCWCGNSSWGDNGYGYLSYKYIDKLLWTAWVAQDISVTKDMLKGTRELTA